MVESFVEAFPRIKRQLSAEEVLHDGKPHLVDPTRRPGSSHYYRRATPEEIVRQSFIRYLIDAAHIPVGALHSEVNLARLGATVGTNRRSDVVIFRGRDPVVLVEVKREEESLISAAYGQGRAYILDALGAAYLLLTNGRTMRLFRHDGDQIVPLDSAPPELRELANQRFNSTTRLLRPEDVDDAFFRMERTETWSVPYLQAFLRALLVAPLVGRRCPQFWIAQDLGTDWGSYRNASGSELGVFGTFRFVEVQFPNGDHDIVGIAMTRYDKPIPPFRPCNRIAVGIGDKSCLEIQTNSSFIRREHGKVALSHDGRINAAGANREVTIERMARELPDLYDPVNARIRFGAVSEDPASADWTTIIMAILRYAVVREVVKAEVKARSARARA